MFTFVWGLFYKHLYLRNIIMCLLWTRLLVKDKKNHVFIHREGMVYSLN